MSEMIDVGILTFHDTSNFGAVLQAYATYHVVESLGYSAEIIDYQCDSIRNREIPIERHRRNGGIKEALKWHLRDYKEQDKYNELIRFLKNKTKLSDKTYRKGTFGEISGNYKSVLVGSDMLWCTRYTDSDYSYMLEGISGSRKLSYGTSVGYRWDNSEEAKILNLISGFDYLAVREADTASYLSSRLGRKIYNVCDPTMLIDSREWENLVADKNKNGSVFVYMDDQNGNCKKVAERYADANGLDLRIAKFQIWPLNKKENAELYTITDFLTAIYKASLVVTASYHGLLFAIYFHIPFVYFNKDSSRMATLATKLGIGYRDGNRFELTDMKDINWDAIDENVTTFRTESMKILSGMLEGV